MAILGFPHQRGIIFTLSLLLLQSDAFTASNANAFHTHRFTKTSLSSVAESDTTDDILKPKYEIEKTALRIGHGFDIHRMIPLEEAGQPVVIGGVTINHKDQKVKKNLES